MFQYTVCNIPDHDVYCRQCRAIEKSVPGIKKVDEFRDVDDSYMSIYEKDGAKVRVCNDWVVGGVFVDSEIDLLPFFKRKEENYEHVIQ